MSRGALGFLAQVAAAQGRVDVESLRQQGFNRRAREERESRDRFAQAQSDREDAALRLAQDQARRDAQLIAADRGEDRRRLAQQDLRAAQSFRVEPTPPNPADAFRLQGAVQELLLSPQPLTPQGTAEGLAGVVGPDDSQTHLADALQPHARQRARKAAADLAQLSKAMGQPGVTQAQVADIQAQFARAYPEFVQRGLTPAPMTSEQAAQIEQQVQVAEYNSAAQQILNGETPDQLLFRDDKGNLSVPRGLIDVFKFKQQRDDDERRMRLDELRQRSERFDREMALLGQAEPEKPGRDATPEEIAQFKRERSSLNVRRRQLFNQFVGDEADTPAPARLERSLRTAEQTGAALVQTQEEYDDLPPGAIGVTPEGETFRKPGANDEIVDIDSPDDPRLQSIPAGAKIRFNGQIIIKN